MSKTSLQDSVEEIDPRELDIGLHNKQTASPPPAKQEVTPSSPDPAKGLPSLTEDFLQLLSEELQEQPQGGETNFFGQPGILAGDYGRQQSGCVNMSIGHKKLSNGPIHNFTFRK